MTTSSLKAPCVLQLALGEKKLDLAWLLCNYGVVLNGPKALGAKLLRDAVEQGNVEAVDFLLTKGVPVSAETRTTSGPLHYYAVRSNQHQIASLLAHHATDLDFQDEKGWTTLHHATIKQ